MTKKQLKLGNDVAAAFIKEQLYDEANNNRSNIMAKKTKERLFIEAFDAFHTTADQLPVELQGLHPDRVVGKLYSAMFKARRAIGDSPAFRARRVLPLTDHEKVELLSAFQ